MHFDECNNQWISVSAFACYGVDLKEKLKSIGITTIPAGTVMVCVKMGRSNVMFQTLQELNLDGIGSNTLIAYEMGSVIFTSDICGTIPAIVYKNCRMPFKNEFEWYNTMKTV